MPHRPEGKTVFFPTIVPVIQMLSEQYGRDVLVVYPENGRKEEYRQRYWKRGNSGSFLEWSGLAAGNRLADDKRPHRR